jgi:hypothetical protein
MTLRTHLPYFNGLYQLVQFQVPVCGIALEGFCSSNEGKQHKQLACPDLLLVRRDVLAVYTTVLAVHMCFLVLSRVVQL